MHKYRFTHQKKIKQKKDACQYLSNINNKYLKNVLGKVKFQYLSIRELSGVISLLKNEIFYLKIWIFIIRICLWYLFSKKEEYFYFSFCKFNLIFWEKFKWFEQKFPNSLKIEK